MFSGQLKAPMYYIGIQYFKLIHGNILKVNTLEHIINFNCDFLK